ncbi:hypothetical protein [Mesotoga sp.]|uniref:hypothetical protein n=1 Tax=Mesotoga sp. TaxID=2053577 RepID=UPI00345E2EC1
MKTIWQEIEELREEIQDLIEREQACVDPIKKANYMELISLKAEELEDLESIYKPHIHV